MKIPPSKGRSAAHNIHLVADGDKMKVALIESEYRFAFELKNAARVMSNYARSLSDKSGYEMRAFVTGAVTLSYSFLEAGLNEFLFLNATDERSPLSSKDKAVIDAMASENLRPRGNQNTLQLFNTVLRLLDRAEMPEKEQPYQAANLVRSLRNLLVHPIPGRVITFSDDPDVDLSKQQLIVRQLRSHLRLGREATFPADVLTEECAKWAVGSCEDFFREFELRSGVDPGFLTDR